MAGNTSGAQFKSLLEKCDLSQLNAAPTFDTGSILDVIVTNSPESVVAHDAAHCHFSRHRFTRALIRVKNCRPEPVCREHRSWNSIDFDSFCDDLAGADWSPVFTTDSTETQSDYVIQKLATVLDEHAPVKRVRVRTEEPPASSPQRGHKTADGISPGGAFAKCILNFGLRPDRPAGIRHRQPMGDRQLRTVACDVTQWRSAL